MFAIVFGLSMDYEVFLVSRIHEEWTRQHDHSAAVRDGLTATGRVITAAAAVMVVVFGSFIFGGSRVIALFGVGLAAAVFLDALVIRCILLPAVLQLLGPSTWAFPTWLDRKLPRFAIEHGRAGRAAAAGTRGDRLTNERAAMRALELAQASDVLAFLAAGHTRGKVAVSVG